MEKGQIKIIVLGPPGSGKSHIATALARWLGARMQLTEVDMRLHDSAAVVGRKSTNELVGVIKQTVKHVSIEEMHVGADFQPMAGWDDAEDTQTTRHFQQQETSE